MQPSRHADDQEEDGAWQLGTTRRIAEQLAGMGRQGGHVHGLLVEEHLLVPQSSFESQVCSSKWTLTTF